MNKPTQYVHKSRRKKDLLEYSFPDDIELIKKHKNMRLKPTERALPYLIKSLQENTLLENLHLTLQPKQEDFELLESLVSTLNNQPQLQSLILNIEFTPNDPVFAEKLSQLIHRLKALKRLNLKTVGEYIQSSTPFIQSLSKHPAFEKLSLNYFFSPPTDLEETVTVFKDKLKIKKISVFTKTPNNENKTGNVEEKRGFLKLKRTWQWHGFANLIKNITLFPLRCLFIPVSLPFSLFFSKIVTQHKEPLYALKNYYDLFDWSRFYVKSKKDQVVRVESLKLKEKSNSLHINIPGSGECGYRRFEIALSQSTAIQCQADQWNMTRHSSWTVNSQKKQILALINTAIEKGYKNIYLNGFSYGGALARKTYHNIMTDPKNVAFLDRHGITLNYAARNTYLNEFIASVYWIAPLTSDILRILFGYKGQLLSPSKQKQNSLKPGKLLKWVSIAFHELFLFDFSLRETSSERKAQQTKSKNFVVNVINTVKTENKPIEIQLDDTVGYHLRTHGNKRHGHHCIEMLVEESDSFSNHILSQEKEYYLAANRLMWGTNRK